MSFSENIELEWRCLHFDGVSICVVGSRIWEVRRQPVLDDVALPMRDWVSSLQVVFGLLLTLETQVAPVAYFQLRLVHQRWPFLDRECLAAVILALIT